MIIQGGIFRENERLHAYQYKLATKCGFIIDSYRYESFGKFLVNILTQNWLSGDCEKITVEIDVDDFITFHYQPYAISEDLEDEAYMTAILKSVEDKKRIFQYLAAKSEVQKINYSPLIQTK